MARADVAAAAALADATLFPADMLAPMAEPGLSGATDDIWLIAFGPDADAVALAFCEPERLADRVWNLRALATAEQHRRKGAARMLVDALEGALRLRRARLLIVETSSAPEQAPARALYPELGFAGGVRVRDFFADGEDKIVFSKRL